MAKSKYYYGRKLRTIEIPMTEADPDGVVLFDLPRGGIDSIKVYVEDAFNTSAKLAIGVPGTANQLVAAQAIDATGIFTCTLANYLHDSTKDTPITGTVSDKAAAGKLRVIVNFYVDRDTNL
jgi:hypothetical protein